VQFDQEMMDCAIFGEFLEKEKGVVGHISHPHIYYSTPQNDMKKLHIKIMMICAHGKKIQSFWNNF